MRYPFLAPTPRHVLLGILPLSMLFARSQPTLSGGRVAQQPLPVLLPGGPEITTAHLQDAAVTVRYLMRAPTGDTAERDLGTTHTDMHQTTYEGAKALLLTTNATRGTQTFVDSALVVRTSLAPVWETSRVGAKVTTYQYSGAHVRRTITSPDSGTRSTEHDYDVPVFHFNELDVLLRSIPLRAGFGAILPLYSEGTDVLEMDTVRVQGPDAAGVWTVRFADPAIIMTYGVSGATRDIVRNGVVQRKTGNLVRRIPVP
jgi:hypothetical protein